MSSEKYEIAIDEVPNFTHNSLKGLSFPEIRGCEVHQEIRRINLRGLFSYYPHSEHIACIHLIFQNYNAASYIMSTVNLSAVMACLPPTVCEF